MVQYQVKQLDHEALQKVQELEQELGAAIVAYQQLSDPAELSSQELDKLQDLEEDLSTILIAYQTPRQTPGK